MNNSNQVKRQYLGYVLLIIIALLILIKFAVKKDDTYNISEYTVNVGEVLPIFEMGGKYNFNMQVLDIKKYSNQYLVIKAKFRNNNNEIMDFSTLNVSFSILTSSNEEISKTADIYKSTILTDNNLLEKISSNKEEEGYIFFYNNDQNFNLDEITKLMVTVPKEEVNKGSYVGCVYSYYYVNLK